MRKANKNSDSEIIIQHLTYPIHSKIITAVLFKEQKGFCAYTDECLTITDAQDIEHFNPNLKGTIIDSYYNWFLVKHQWNKKKSNKWDEYQPLLFPTANDFEERIVYDTGDYITKEGDVEASNTIKLLQLDNAELAEKRKRYIRRKRDEIERYGNSALVYFSDLTNNDICDISYPRAIREEFDIDILSILR